MSSQRQLLKSSRLPRGHIRGKDLIRAIRLVLALIIENVRAFGDDLAYGQCPVAENAHGKFSTWNESLQHDLVIMPVPFVDRRFNLFLLLNHRYSPRPTFFIRLYAHT